jgi:hypothetical protein
VKPSAIKRASDAELTHRLKEVDAEIAAVQSILDSVQREANWIRKEQKRRKDEHA